MKQVDHDNESSPLGQSRRQLDEAKAKEPAKEEWLPVRGRPGIEQCGTRVRTNIPKNNGAT